jgi:hypothetical protein
MTSETIDHATLAHLIEGGVVRAAHVIGQEGGWGIVIKYGTSARALAASRSRRVRIFKKLETLVSYLKELGIQKFDVDAANFDVATLKTYSRPDRAAALKQAHQAAAHDKWFRAQVAQGIKEADDPNTQWVSQQDAKASWAKKRAALTKRVERAKA